MTADHSPEPQNQNQPPIERSKAFASLVTILTASGILGVLAGLIHLLGAMASGFTLTSAADVVFNIIFGGMIFYCSRVLARGKALVIWLAMGCVALSILYSFALGRGFNYVIATVGALFIWQLFKLKQQGELL